MDFSEAQAPAITRTFLGDVSTLAEAQTFELAAGGFSDAVIHMIEGGHSIAGEVITDDQ